METGDHTQGKQIEATKQANSKTKKEPVINETNEKRTKIPGNKDNLVKDAEWDGFKYTGNKAQVTHISNQLRNKEGK